MRSIDLIPLGYEFWYCCISHNEVGKFGQLAYVRKRATNVIMTAGLRIILVIAAGFVFVSRFFWTSEKIMV
jgi:hypothetical protein